mgnify:FL=1
MIDKSHLRTTMLALTEAELAQAHKTLNASLLPRGWIVLNRSRTTNRRRPKLPPIWQKRLMTLSTKRRPRLPQLQVWISARRPKLAPVLRCASATAFWSSVYPPANLPARARSLSAFPKPLRSMKPWKARRPARSANFAAAR